MMDDRGGDTGIVDILDHEGLRLCTCGRDPSSAEVRAEAIKVMALSVRYGLVTGGCLRDAALAFDEIYVNLVPSEARQLDTVLTGIRQSMNADDGGSGCFGAEPDPMRLH